MPSKTVRMLFIGNSFTTRNDLPGLLSAIAEAGACATIESRVIAAGGASLRRHWNAGAADTISDGKWDYVLFQEQSRLPIKNGKRFHENVREFVPVMKESGATMVLFMTWARKHEPENQKLLIDSYNSIGKELAATVVPVGSAWREMLEKHDTPELYAEDGSHPTLAGSYLAACVFYTTLFDGDLKDLETEVGGLSHEERRLLQQIARSASGSEQ
ncbi:MAG: hypothetical protein CL698_07700 [Chloroflexi bacterium]|nr:hypothetical protein [Chloroflexota bacterium]